MIKAKKELGQNFLIDEVALNRIIELINPRNEDHFLEIGPGRGALTKRLSDKAKRLDAVELDQDLLLSLKLINSNKLFIHNESILNFDVDRIIEYEKIRLVGNLPYNISTEIMLWAFDSLKQLEDMHFMFQKEFGERLSAEPNNKSYGRISVLTQYLTELEKVLYLEPSSFRPKPSVESVFIRFKPKKDRHILSPISIKLQEITKATFMHRRKMIGKSLKNILTTQQIEQLDIDLSLRPENLSVNDYVRIAEQLI
jgi:16S rRNA (adenine1518-N6/adenine1519-N6)-dimethyltransferase|tara:strand:- start:681 stop:1445 length:765 start_codon:yes stop_codon:yes gene_type:complete